MKVQRGQAGGASAADATPQHPALAALLAGGPPSPEAIAAFLAAEAFPLIEPGAATFVHAGDADAVELLRWIHAGTERTAFKRVAGTPLWVLRLPVEDGGRFEYKLAIHSGGTEVWALDALNPARAVDPFGENSVCSTAGYLQPGWSRPSGAPAGRIESIRRAERGVRGDPLRAGLPAGRL